MCSESETTKGIPTNYKQPLPLMNISSAVFKVVLGDKFCLKLFKTMFLHLDTLYVFFPLEMSAQPADSNFFAVYYLGGLTYTSIPDVVDGIIGSVTVMFDQWKSFALISVL